MKKFQAKPTRIKAELWNGGLGQDGVKPGRNAYEWFGIEVWKEGDHWLVLDEHGKRSVLTSAELKEYYEPC